MRSIYAYTATTREGAAIKGALFAGSAAAARRILNSRGLAPQRVYYEPALTVSWHLSPKFKESDLAQLYNWLGRNIESGDTPADALRTGKLFVEDVMLRNACEEVIAAMDGGANLGGAMRVAGFSSTDCALISSLGAESGGFGDAFLRRAKTLQYEAKASQMVGKEVWVFLLLLTATLSIAWLIFFVLVPTMGDRMSPLVHENKRTDFVRFYFDVGEYIKANRVWLSGLYFGLLAVLFWLFTGDRRDRIIAALFPAYGRFHLLINHYRVWQLWMLLHRARGDIDIFNVAERVVTHVKVRREIGLILSGLANGLLLEVIVPRVIGVAHLRDQLTAVLRSRDVDRGTVNFLDTLEAQIDNQRDKTVGLISIIGKIFIGIMLFFFFSAIIVPNMLIAANIL